MLDDNNRSDFRDLGHTGPYALKDSSFAISNLILLITEKDLSVNVQFN